MDPAVELVESYLRLNGYFTVTEFQVQHPIPDQPGHYATATDLDILAVRFPWAAEAPLHRHAGIGDERCEFVLAGDPALDASREVADVLVGEVKEGAAELNRRLTTPQVLHAVLRRIGCVPDGEVAGAAAALLQHGEVALSRDRGLACRVRLASFCGYVEEPPRPASVIITLGHMFRFIQDHLVACRALLQSAQFKDHTLSLLKLMEKLHITMGFAE